MATTPRSNRGYWIDKFESNRRRDARNAVALRRNGYRVATVWECALERPAILERRLARFLGEDK